MERTAFTYEVREQMLVTHLSGELDHRSYRNLKQDTGLLLAENYINQIVFDFIHTSFINSSGIGILLDRYKQVTASRGTVACYGTEPQVKRILETGGVSRLVRGYKDRESVIRG